MDWILLSYCLIDYPLKKTNWPADLEKVEMMRYMRNFSSQKGRDKAKEYSVFYRRE